VEHSADEVEQTLRTEALQLMALFRTIPRFQTFLSIFLDMCTTSSYRAYHWLYPGSYQPLQPTAVLLVDLSDYPRSAEAVASRKLIDRTFSLLGPYGRLTNGITMENTTWQRASPASAGARQVWDVLEKLRWKVWQAGAGV
jgi:hypothetical protein